MRDEFIVTAGEDGLRATDLLRHRRGYSGLQVKKIRLYGSLLRNGKFCRMIDTLHEGDRIQLELHGENELPPGTILHDTNGIHILYQDEWLLLVSKPAGLLTHPSYTGERESLITLLSEYELHPVSRLDRETSGLVLLAKSGHAHYRLSRPGLLEKRYIAFQYGVMEQDTFRWEAAIGRREGSIIEREVRPDGAPSLTEGIVLARFSNLAQKAELRLHSGRTHQIRVHSRYFGHALIGDTLYPPQPADSPSANQNTAHGNARAAKLCAAAAELGHQALHASSLRFIHPFTGQLVDIKAELPRELRQLENELRKIAEA